MNARDALVLGRVSNLPTVWSNVLAGMALACAGLADAGVTDDGLADALPAPLPLLAALLPALSLAYVAGMYLNDAFDAAIDRRERPERPIPSGRVPRRTVFAAGFAMLAAALALLALVGLAGVTGGPAWAPFAAGAVLCVAIVAYDAWHKANPLAPVLMGLCRALVYVTAAVAFASLTSTVVVGACILWAYLIGLTYAAKEESLNRIGHAWPLAFLLVPIVYGFLFVAGSLLAALIWIGFVVWTGIAVRRLFRRRPGDVPRAVAALLAGICLLDALIITVEGLPGLALVAVALFALTLLLQRFVPAT
ncbi:MAG: UbiA family prenyltransferase [Rhodospirillales bacterium]